MNAAEIIQAAIDKLEDLRQRTVAKFDQSDFDPAALTTSDGFWVGELAYEDDADLIVTLHRTIDAQLAILRVAGREFERRAEQGDARVYPYDYHLDLARAILGGDS